MTKSTIITEPNSILHKKCRKVTKFDNKLKKIADQMVGILYEKKGIGLAAPQITQEIRLIVVEYNPKRFADEDKVCNGDSSKSKPKIEVAIPLTVLVNPKITNFSQDTRICEEGCLSLPGIELSIKRAQKITVLAYNLQGERLKIRAKDLFARVLQHEIDHLSGILITDRATKKPPIHK